MKNAKVDDLKKYLFQAMMIILIEHEDGLDIIEGVLKSVMDEAENLVDPRNDSIRFIH